MSYEAEKADTIDAYQRIAGDFNQRNAVSIYAKEFDIFGELTGPGKKILEIGCGTGCDAAELVKRGYAYTGIDASSEMLKIAQARLPGQEFKAMDFYHLDFPDDTFDGFWAAAAYLHVPKAQLVGALTEARRVLKQDGVGFISVKRKTTIDEGVIEESKGGGIKRYFSFFTEEEMTGFLTQAGFKIETMTQVEESDGTHWLCFFVRKI